MPKLTTNVTIYNPDTGKAETYGPGDDLPDYFAELCTNPDVWDDAPAHDDSGSDENTGGSSENAQSYDGYNKDDLIGMAEARGLDSSGTKADIIERLQAADAEG